MQTTITIHGFSTLDNSPAQGYLMLDRTHLFQNNISGRMEFYKSRVSGSYLRHKIHTSESVLVGCSIKGDVWLLKAHLYAVRLSLPKKVSLRLTEIAWWRDVP